MPEPRARAVMILGTASNAGKSIVVTALCRIFANMSIDVAPFKAQNMSLNSAATPDGLEIGRAQALQAEAARRPPVADMNPILVKPSGERRAQIVVDGKIWGEHDAWELYRSRPGMLFERAFGAYERLAATCELVVLEGAGSPAEINLRAGDIVNMRMARAAKAPCVLVADIDRGGAFASLVGTLALLEPDDREWIAGFALNKFRGDRSLLEPGIETIERRLGIPCLGVIPWLDDMLLDEEDSYGAFRPDGRWGEDEGEDRPLRIAVVRLPSLSNATDFHPLAAEPDVTLRWIDAPSALESADVAILPGSKQTLGDLRWIRARGLDHALLRHARRKPVIGICGGLQMLGVHVADPGAVEGGGASDGLGLLRLKTVLTGVKTTVPVRASLAGERLFGLPLGARSFFGYEIHVGRSDVRETPFAKIVREDGSADDDGAISADGNVIGTYVHGLFDDDAFRHTLLSALRSRCGLGPAADGHPYTRSRDERIERLAAHVAANLDVEAVLRLAGYAGAASR